MMARTFALLIGWLLYAPALWAHMTLIPHHKEDFEDLATGRDKRVVVLLITTVFVAGLAALGSFMLRQSRHARPTEDLRAGQERLKAALIHVATILRPQMNQSRSALIALVAATYAECVGVPAPQWNTLPAESFPIGKDVLTVRSSAAHVEITAVCEVAGASVTLAADGSSAVRVFAARSAGSASRV